MDDSAKRLTAGICPSQFVTAADPCRSAHAFAKVHQLLVEVTKESRKGRMLPRDSLEESFCIKDDVNCKKLYVSS